MTARNDSLDIAHWLAEGGLRNRPLADMFDGFTSHLLAEGVRFDRAYFGMSTRHPLIRAFDMIWESEEEKLAQNQFDHSWPRSSAWTDSPLRHMVLSDQPRMRRILQGPDAVLDFPLFQELSARGFTDWYGAVAGFETEEMLGQPGSLGMACSWSTAQAGGFTDANLALFDRLFPLYAVSVKAAVMPTITRTLLGAYIGNDAALRVWSGATNRGSIQRVEAAIFFSDLRGFTAFAEQTSSDAVMALLNRYFDLVGAAVTSNGGHILKFMGDGILATFAAADGTSSGANVCEQALRAALDACAAVAKEDSRLEIGIALHKGEVMYGNVGTQERLDFTMIGPAVNEAARMEKLTKALGCSILASDSFRAGLAESRDKLTPAGSHALSGLSEPRALYRVDVE